MGRQEGLIQITGRIANLSFYRSQDGYMVRKKSGVSAERIMSDPAYARTRENNAEFARGAQATKLIRKAFSSFIRASADNRVTGRLTSAIMKAIKADVINEHGQRNVTDGKVAFLQGFEFNKHAGLAETFEAPFTTSIDRATGSMTVNVPAFLPANLITAPEAATHFRLKAVGAAINFTDNTFAVATSQSVDLTLNEEVQGPLQLMQTIASVSVDPLFLVFGIEFLQFVNDVQYPLTDGVLNPMAIVRIDELPRTELSARNIAKLKITPVSALNYSPPKSISEGQQIALAASGNNFFHGHPLLQLPAIDSHVHDIRTGRALLAIAPLVSPGLTEDRYPIIKDHITRRISDLQANLDWVKNFKPRDG